MNLFFENPIGKVNFNESGIIIIENFLDYDFRFHFKVEDKSKSILVKKNNRRMFSKERHDCIEVSGNMYYRDVTFVPTMKDIQLLCDKEKNEMSIKEKETFETYIQNIYLEWKEKDFWNLQDEKYIVYIKEYENMKNVEKEIKKQESEENGKMKKKSFNELDWADVPPEMTFEEHLIEKSRNITEVFKILDFIYNKYKKDYIINFEFKSEYVNYKKYSGES